jgi:hypothetical protein
MNAEKTSKINYSKTNFTRSKAEIPRLPIFLRRPRDFSLVSVSSELSVLDLLFGFAEALFERADRKVGLLFVND